MNKKYMNKRLPRFINKLSYEELKEFFNKFSFVDYDFQIENDLIDLSVLEINGTTRNVKEFYITEYKTGGDDSDLSFKIKIAFRKFLIDKFGDRYLSALKKYNETLLDYQK